MIDKEHITLHIPALLIREENCFVVVATDEGEAMLGQPAYSQGSTREEAEKEFWAMLRIMNEFHEERSRELDCWKPFQKGNWGHIGGTWFTIYGFHFYFRRGRGMQGGWYVPGTKLNISISNYWKHRKIKKDATTQDRSQV